MKTLCALPWPDWEIVRRLGGGSYGTVYEIRRERFGIEERAAMKLVSFPKDPEEVEEQRCSGYTEESLVSSYRQQMQRFLDEYKLMLELKGGVNIVRCDDFQTVQHEDGIGWDIFIKMELLTPLKKYLGREITAEQTVKLGVDLCKALSLCREKGIIHRDIKPDNILVSDAGDYKLGDFGVAKTAERTMAGTRTGTPNFVAPEVYHNEPYGKSVDIYSLGMVLYWMLNRRALPFLPLPPQMPSPDEIQEAMLRRMRGEALPRPADGSRALQDVVLKACAYRPEDRYATPEAFCRALEAAYAADTGVADTLRPAAPPQEQPSHDADATMGNNWETGSQTEAQPELTDLDATEATMGTCGTMAGSYPGCRLNETLRLHNDPTPFTHARTTKGDDKKVRVTIFSEDAENGCRIAVRSCRRGEMLNVDVPRHAVDGQVLVVDGAGHASRDGGEAGDLLVQLHVVGPRMSEAETFQSCDAEITADVSRLTLSPGESTKILLKASGDVPEVFVFRAQWQPDITVEFGDRLDTWNTYATVTATKESEGYIRFYISDKAETFDQSIHYASVDVYVTVQGASMQADPTAADDGAIVKYLEKGNQVGLSGVVNSETLQRAQRCMRECKTNNLFILASGRLSRETVRQISLLSELDSLKITCMEEGAWIEDLAPLKALKSLHRLWLSEMQITDISALADLPQLTHLFLEKNVIRDLTPLAKLQNLTELDISGNQVTDLLPLEKLSELEFLDFSRNQVSRLRPLLGLTKIEILLMENNPVSDLTPLSAMTKLKLLDISATDVTSLKGLENARSLDVLIADDYRLTDLSALEASGCRGALRRP